MRRTLPLLALLCVLTSTGCVDGTVRVTVLPDGAGSIAIDLGYDPAQWPPLFGDPYAGFLERDELRRWMDPGMVAWSQPRVVDGETSRRWQGEVFFDDIDDVQFLGRHEGKVIEAMGFRSELERGRLHLRPGFLVYLDDPLPLPSPERVGMKGVSLSPALLDAIRQRIRPVVEGLDVTLEVVLPGPATRVDGLDRSEGRVGFLHVDADRLARAFTGTAAELTDVEELRENPSWAWQTPPTVPASEIAALRARRAAAVQWWNAVEGHGSSDEVD